MILSISLERKRGSAVDSQQKEVGLAVMLQSQCPVGCNSQCDCDQGADAPRQHRGSTAVHLAARALGERRRCRALPMQSTTAHGVCLSLSCAPHAHVCSSLAPLALVACFGKELILRHKFPKTKSVKSLLLLLLNTKLTAAKVLTVKYKSFESRKSHEYSSTQSTGTASQQAVVVTVAHDPMYLNWFNITLQPWYFDAYDACSRFSH